MTNRGKVEITPPAELWTQIGQSMDDGTHLELMTTFVKKGDKLCIASVEGVPFPGYDADGNPTGEGEAAPPMASEFGKSYRGHMGQAEDGGGY